MLIEQNVQVSELEAFFDVVREEASRRKTDMIGSFMFSCGDESPVSVVSALERHFDRVFYWGKPESGRSFAAAGSVIEVRSEGPGRFDELNGEVAHWKNRFVRSVNHAFSGELPFFVGVASFWDRLHEDVWSEFSPSMWFVPEVVFINLDGQTFGAFQFMASAGSLVDESVARLEYLQPLLTFSEEPPAWHNNGSGEEPVTPFISETYKAGVAEALQDIARQSYEKIVLSRSVRRTTHEVKSCREWIERLVDAYPECQIFLFKSGRSTFFGASPERLIRFEKGRAECNAVAGSIERGTDEKSDFELGQRLLESEKNLQEHRYVVQHLRSVMESSCREVELDPVPTLKKLPYIQHLYLQMEGLLREDVSIVDVLRRIHPTPAVGGYPAEEALRRLPDLEGYDRGLYAGFAGWFNLDGAGDFCVSIRSAHASGNSLNLFAGAGIVEGSDPDAELEETEIKLKAISSLLLH